MDAKPVGSSVPSSASQEVQGGIDLLALRAQLARAEKAARRAPTPIPVRPAQMNAKPVKPQREVDLAGVATDDFSLARAHAKLREAVYEGQYHVCAHAIGHARAEGFLEHDIMQVLLAGRVRAVYPEDRRWLVCGYFEACGVALPLHVVVQHPYGRSSRQGRPDDAVLDIVTAFVPKHPHHIISRARLAVMLRYDDEQIRSRTAQVGNRAGHRSKGKWKRSA
ncbi:DUF4258 domain-containing protein [Deinococcus puniceus]|uniref:DUF4258 domain-containing protein n=1 Tax=Deinococcus puniceus TaxID=1182568 RepID=A0A172T8U2_9DEIO|nr:DUF4258 domain-containing protein [Deinococcus puniceus]ANE43223.1 hypothetical protein SU48_04970 [Deinococcus puniceus]